MVVSEFGVKNMKLLIHPALYKCFRLVVASRTFRPLSTTAYLKTKPKLKKTVKYNEKKIKKKKTKKCKTLKLMF